MLLGTRCTCKDKVSSPITKYNTLDPALCLELRKIVEAISVQGKGLLASDESPASLNEKFEELGIENTEINRRDYRQMLFSTDKSELTKYISGIILHHETVYQKTSDGVGFTEYLRQRNIIPGIKVDKGLIEIFGTDDEYTTQGLDSLQERCIQYKKEGCHFTKWRCTFSISETRPSQLAMITNANVLARYATICQSARLVPIVEPEILHTGDYNIKKALEIHEEMLSILFRTLNQHKVYLEGMILKPAMVLPGDTCKQTYTPQNVAECTLTALQRTVPPAMSTILFLSGGQTDEESVLNLNAINTYDGKKPWTISFCYGRALQRAALKTWKGNQQNVAAAQTVFLERARLCSEAALGKSDVRNACMRNVSDVDI